MISFDKNIFTTDKTTEATKAVPNPETLNPGTIFFITNNNKALITKVNKPKVSTLIGKVSKISKGFINIVNIPQTTDKTISVSQPLIVNPGTK